jgi:hypothetical protein
MSNHTPGPWSADHTVLRNGFGESIASAGNNRKVRGDELRASLQLAAAAPEMLRALRNLLPTWIGDIERRTPGLAQQIRDAITKAEGVQS